MVLGASWRGAGCEAVGEDLDRGATVSGQIVVLGQPVLTFTATKDAGFAVGDYFSISGYPVGLNGDYRVDCVQELESGDVEVTSTQILGDAPESGEVPAAERMRAPEWAKPLA